jgi:prolipoprotein diacylglyceryltransferase
MPSITIEQSHNLQEVFYVGSYMLMLLFLVWLAIRRKYPLYPFLLILVSMSLFAMIGGKLMSYSIVEWNKIIHEFRFPYTERKRILGYLLFGFLGLLIARKTLKFDRGIYEMLAYAWPIRLMVGRMGCLFGGCCYGIPTQADWGIRYAPSFPAFQDHLHSGLISFSSGHSLFVHPTQAYEAALGCVIFLVTIWAGRKKFFKHDLSLLIFSFAIYGFFRFFIEFLRAGITTLHGLDHTQLGILLLLVIFLLILLIIEKKLPVYQGRSYFGDEVSAGAIWLGLGIITLILLLLPWMSPLESVICTVVLLILISGTLYQIIRTNPALYHMKVSAAMLLISVLFMGQVADVPNDTLKVIRNHLTIGFGGITGREEQMCGGYSQYNAIGGEIGYAFSDKSNHNHYFATQLYRMNYDNHPYAGISPYYEYRGRLFGIGAGFNYSPYHSELKDVDLYPRASLRFGSLDKFFIEGRFSDHLPSGLPQLQVGVGFRIGHMTPYNYQNILRIGISDAGFYVNPRFNLNDQLILDPYFAFGSKENYQLGLRLSVPIYLKGP